MTDAAPAVMPPPSQASAVKKVPLAKLKFDPDNARLHPDDSIASLCASLQRFGQPMPILAQENSGVVIAGNGRLEAMQKLGWTHAQVRYVDWDDARCREYSLSDNRTSELSTWDAKRMREQVDALPDDFDWGALGFADADLDDLLGEDRGDAASEGVEDDDVPEVPKSPESKPGTVWLLGDHRLICGDSQDAAVVRRLLAGSAPEAVLTDPPYGVDYVGKTKDALTIHNDGREGLRPLLQASLGLAAEVTRPGAVWYVAAPAGPAFLEFAQVLADLKVWRQTIVWVKNTLVMGHSDFHYRHEAIFYGWTPGADRLKPPDRKQDTVWEIDRPSRSTEHPTMKPVELYARMLEMSTRAGALVYEPFGGSGTTLIACEQMGRRCCAVELDPGYCDVIVQRWSNLTGRKANREG